MKHIWIVSDTHRTHTHRALFSRTFLSLRYNQINAIGMACHVGVESCRELIKRWYRKWMENPNHNP